MPVALVGHGRSIVAPQQFFVPRLIQSFRPSDIPGLKVWLMADSLALNDNDAVGTWTDLSGNGFNATQATTALKPLFKTNILNGKPVLRFDGIQNWMQTAALNMTEPNTIIVVAKQTSKATPGRFVDSNPQGVNRQLIGLDQTTGFLGMYAGTTPLGDSTDHSGAFHILSGIFNGASSFSYLDGVQLISGNPGVGWSTSEFILLGTDFTGSGQIFLTGDIAEVLVYQNNLSIPDRQAVENYLTSKYFKPPFTLNFTATFSPAGALNLVTSHLMTATFSPTATLVKKVIDAGFAATLSFSGVLIASKFFQRAFTATLSFAGALNRQVNKVFAATLSSTATLVKKIIDAGFIATLSFTGALVKKIIDAGFAATLSFSGFLAASKTFLRSFTATLSFAGAFSRRVNKVFVATLSDTATLTKRIIDAGFTATLSFSGALTRRIGKVLLGTLSFVGNLATSFIAGGGHLFTQSFTATLNTAAALQRSTRKTLTATLSPVAALTKKIIDSGFTATLSFTGNLARTRLFIRAFTATLTFSGVLQRGIGKSLNATLTFSAAVGKGIRKRFSATLSFVGQMLTGTALVILADWIRTSTLRIFQAGSNIKGQQAQSGLNVIRTGSDANAQQSSSDLKAPKTE